MGLNMGINVTELQHEGKKQNQKTCMLSFSVYFQCLSDR